MWACARSAPTSSSRVSLSRCRRADTGPRVRGVFTGIVEELGTITAIEGDADGLRLQIDAPGLAPLCHIGDSINVSGCCLTVVGVEGSALAFEAVPETLRRTALGGLAAGAGVNLEDALRAG